ncbi:MAG TPA: UDP-N-acetylglucosamine 2-epimerase (non-hydrolyzing) [Stellaceae bacterium]|jgi:UDP-N-acetylglucosamine 2-epimerase (non-hydrolysing)|nr:UDP-N-acetylglucosamine 2-epimerase (non-hydrolyzing) [Stellaceae bacterium]
MKVLVVFGTRPEAIKMAPVVKALAATPSIRPIVCLTGQHRDMLAGILDFFSLKADHDLAIMRPGQDLVYVTNAVLSGVQQVIAAEQPDWVLVHGDTTSAMAAAMAAFYARVRIGHVEAGLRSGDLRQPWPEEMNRSVIDRIADLMFAPTEGARTNLLRENLPAANIVVTGNTVVDALLAVRSTLAAAPALEQRIAADFKFLDRTRRLVLVTGHRRESFGAGFEQICAGLRDIAQRDDVQIVYPVHLNPAVQGPVRRILGDLLNVHLLEPVDYVPFVYLMARSHIIVTDSGGIQEEAPSLGKPVLVMRDVTERPEAVAAGTVALVGANRQRIRDAVVELLDVPARYAAFARAHNPYGDGLASERIREALLGMLAAPAA